jgi:glucosamine--fructose-6-phosphate aminotransferase (isomerizing)
MHVIDGAEFSEKDIPKIGNTALIFLSQSGETKDLHRCIEIGKDKDLFMIGVINVVDSMISRETNCGCYLNAGREVGVASTKSFTNQVIVLSMMAVWFSQIHDKSSNKRKLFIESLRKLPYDIKNTIKISNECQEMMVNILNKDNLFVLGKGKSEAIAKEGSLKIKEITYIHAEGYSGSALKHGPFALLDENVPVILVAPKDEHYAKMNNAYEEIRSRDSPVLFITDDDECIYENKVVIPKNKIFSDLLSVIPLQLAAYYISVERGLNPDMPKNLAKCVTVE